MNTRSTSGRALLLVPCLIALVALHGTPLASPPPEVMARLAACEDIAPLLGPGAKKAPTVEQVGASDVWHVAVSSTQRWLVSLGEECRSRRVGRADFRATAELVARNPGKEKAYFLATPDGCEGCPMVGAVRGKAETPLVARWFDDGCDAGGTLEVIRLFPDTDSLSLRCRESMGAAWRETLLLLDGDLHVLLRADMGFRELPTDDERREGRCGTDPVGWLKVITRGERPVIEVLSPESEDMEDGRGTAQVWHQQWDPAKRSFERTGKPRSVPFDMRRKCR